MKNIFLALVLCSSYARVMSMQQEEKKQHSAVEISGVKKLNDNLYVGKAADNFYLAMERVTPENIASWLDYAKRQVIGTEHVGENPYLPNADGAAHFAKVLKQYKDGLMGKNNELWIAYASNKPISDVAKFLPYHYIDMYVTVTTSPDALITSHMGISRTAEAAIDFQKKSSQRIKHADQSIHLHSFAAKVIKKLDPKKVYMLTAPAIAMRGIIIKKMPENSVFIGDDIYQKKIEDAEKDHATLLGAYDLREKEHESPEKRKARLKAAAEEDYKLSRIKEKFELLKTHQPRIIRTKDENGSGFIIKNQDNSAALVAFNKQSSPYAWMFTQAYEDRGLTLPYILVDLNKLALATQLQSE